MNVSVKKKTHHEDEIRYCQSRSHRILHEFKNGESAYIVKTPGRGSEIAQKVIIDLVYCALCIENQGLKPDKEIVVVREQRKTKYDSLFNPHDV